MIHLKIVAILTGLIMISTVQAHEVERNTLVPEGQMLYQPSIFPDRIILLATTDPHANQTVNWRTDTSITEATAQISVALDTPGLHLHATTVKGDTSMLESGNGPAHHHSVRFSGLEPDTLYAYRVRGGETWSEWFHFRTAYEDFAPFSFIYFGDAQNSVKSHFSRVIRQAWRSESRAALMLHAGDLVNQRENSKHDDEWGEWFDAGNFLHASIPAIVVAGNHEHLSLEDAGGNEYYELAELWSAHFMNLPPNGISELPHTVYYTLYQDVLFVVLDSTMALEDPALAQKQADWLEQVLANNPARWTVVTNHHPVYSVSMGRDNPVLREYWQPLYDRFGVDMVLQGHDHVYGRGANIAQGATVMDGESGPVYVVSVAGPKMYLVSDDARVAQDRVGEDVQLYQVIHVEADRLRYESRTATGKLYDAFDIEREADGSKRVVVRTDELIDEQSCANPSPPSSSRCWNGVELVD